MKIKMIRDKGNLKKGNSYTLSAKKTQALLTEGYCVRVKEKTQIKKAEIKPATKTKDKK